MTSLAISTDIGTLQHVQRFNSHPCEKGRPRYVTRAGFKGTD